LLKRIQQDAGMSMIFVTHDFGVVARMFDRVAVMYAGRIVETATTSELFDRPQHPYTRALLDCLPRLDPGASALVNIEGQPPDLGSLSPGCRFAPRCARASDACREYPPEQSASPSHRVSCWHPGGPGDA
jgi:oligopeptide/dipeptide ABC transporter ATP-binding protein